MIKILWAIWITLWLPGAFVVLWVLESRKLAAKYVAYILMDVWGDV
jgi:hypothetical protein